MKYRKGTEKRGCDGDISISLKFKPCPRHHSILLAYALGSFLFFGYALGNSCFALTEEFGVAVVKACVFFKAIFYKKDCFCSVFCDFVLPLLFLG